MRLKKILFIVLIILAVLLINFLFIDDKIYYLNLNTIDSNDYSIYYKEYLEKNHNLEYYNNYYNVKDYRITDLIRMIKDNKEITIDGKKQKIENAIIKADIITIWVGMNEIKYKIDTTDIEELYKYSDTILTDLEELFLLLRKISKEKIIFLNFYNPGDDIYDEVIDYLNKKMNAIAIEYKIDILDVNHIINKKISKLNYQEIGIMLEEI